MDIIKKAITCSVCKTTLDAPVLLPCGKSICEKHVNNESDAYACDDCDLDHLIPENGFPRNKIAEDLVRTKIQQFNLGEDYENLKESCVDFKAIIESIQHLKNDPTLYINETIGEIKNAIDLRRDELKLQIDEEAQVLIDELDEYEEECKANLISKEFTDTSLELGEFLRSMSTDLDKWQSQLDIFEINVDKLKQMYQDSNQKLEELQDRKQKLTKSLLKNQLTEYKERKVNFINKEFSSSSKYTDIYF
jgi:hypothetical protein